MEVSYALIEEWHTDLYKKFAEKTKISGTYALLLYSFNKPQYERRGVVFTKESKEAMPRIASFIEKYSLDDVVALVKALEEKKQSKIQLFYYSYVAGVGDSVTSLKKPKCVAVNLDTLHDDLCSLLPSDLDRSDKKDIVKAINIICTFEDESENPDKVAEDFNVVIDRIIKFDADNAQRTELLNQYRITSNELPYFIDSGIVEDIAGFVYDNPLSETIEDMRTKNQSFYAIALKILYDNEEFKKKITDALEELATEKKAEYEKKRLERRIRKFVKDDRGSIVLNSKESPVIEKLEIFGLPDIVGFSVPIK